MKQNSENKHWNYSQIRISYAVFAIFPHYNKVQNFYQCATILMFYMCFTFRKATGQVQQQFLFILVLTNFVSVQFKKWETENLSI